jgi:hypothetical protein
LRSSKQSQSGSAYGHCSGIESGRPLLAEAVGEIYAPEDSFGNMINTRMLASTHQSSLPPRSGSPYRLKIHRGLRPDDSNAGICQIGAAVIGTWTLYLNHSCNANTKLQQYSVGDKVFMRVRVEGGKNVGFGEVLTVNDGGGKVPHGTKDCLPIWRILPSVCGVRGGLETTGRHWERHGRKTQHQTGHDLCQN